MPEVFLVCMPFGPVFRPAIGLSLLKAGLAREGIDARVRYFSIDFAGCVGQHFYYGLSTEERPPHTDLAGEWIFAGELFRPGRRETAAYVREVLRKRGDPDEEGASDALVRKILDARRKVRPFLDSCVAEVLAQDPRLVGFTSMFQQHAASLALAQRIKRERPEITVVFGGANCEGVMGAETVRRFPFVDAAVSGEGDLVFPKLVKRILGSRSLRGVQGVFTRTRGAPLMRSGEPPNAPVVKRLDDLPDPDHSDYFEQFEASRYGPEWQPSLPFETARGCWWGQKRPCLFCGINGRTRAYRSKSPQRARDELLRLVSDYPECDIGATDTILDPRYFKSFLPDLARRRLGLSFCWETKSGLEKDQLRLLAAAGVRSVQPGIESLSDAVLSLMRKGVTGLQNVQMLKWCREVGIHAYWNFLWGFPGEPPAEYARMARLVPLLTHLTPPVRYGPVRLDRFSPLFRDSRRLGLARVAPLPAYRHVYPLPDTALGNLAYFFRYGYRESRDVAGYVEPLERALESWMKDGRHCDFFSVAVGDQLLLWDFRRGAREPLTILDGLDKALYEAADAARPLARIARVATGRSPGRALRKAEEGLERLTERGLILRDGARWLALALPLGEHAPRPGVVERFRETVRHLGKRVAGGVVIPLTAGTPAAPRRPPRGSRPHLRSRRRDRTLSASDFSFHRPGELFVRIGPDSSVR
jgi:ribosomal peptide maturation radical SAM protein 1